MKHKAVTRLIVLLAGLDVMLALIVLGSPWRLLLDSLQSLASSAVQTSALPEPSPTPLVLGGSSIEPMPTASLAATEQPARPTATWSPTVTSSPAPTQTPAPTRKPALPASKPIALETSGYSISGRVLDINNRPIPGVQILASGLYSATTDASGAYTLTHLVTATYTLTPTKPLYVFSPTSRTSRVPGDATGQDFVVAPDIGFRPERDGYSFNNPSYAKPNCSDLQRAFSGLPIQCSQDQPQKEYLDLFDRFQFAFGTGTCTGMAATSLGYFAKVITPPKASTTWDLKEDQAWNNIAAFHGRQYSKGVLDRRVQELARWNSSDPNQISRAVNEAYRQLRLAVQPGNPDPVVIDLVPRGGCNVPTPGLTDTPYRLDESDPLRPKVYIYENYAAGDSNRFIQFDFSEPVHRFTYWKWDSSACSALLVMPLSAFTGPEGTVPSGHVEHVK